MILNLNAQFIWGSKFNIKILSKIITDDAYLLCEQFFEIFPESCEWFIIKFQKRGAKTKNGAKNHKKI